MAAVGVTLVLWASAFVAIRHLAGDLLRPARCRSVGSSSARSAWAWWRWSARGPRARPTRGQWVSIVTIGVLWFGVYNVALNAGERARRRRHRRDADPGLTRARRAAGRDRSCNERFTLYLGLGLALAFSRRRPDRRPRPAAPTATAACSGVALCLVAAVVYSDQPGPAEAADGPAARRST